MEAHARLSSYFAKGRSKAAFFPLHSSIRATYARMDDYKSLYEQVNEREGGGH